jgi:predicted PurR-regulated permease PerM
VTRATHNNSEPQGAPPAADPPVAAGPVAAPPRPEPRTPGPSPSGGRTAEVPRGSVGIAAAAGSAADEARPVRLATPSLAGIVRAVLILVACAIGLYLVWRVRGVIRLVGISLFFALALFPLVDAITAKTRLPRALVILITYVVLIAGVAVVGYVVVPSLVKEVEQLSHNAPHYAAELRRNGTFRHYDNRYHLTTKLVHDAHRLPQILGQAVGPLKDVTVQAANFIGQLITVLAISFLLILHGREYVNLGLSLTGSREKRYRQLIIDINRAVADYVLGNIVISVLATLATWIVLTILGVPYALSLAFVVGFFDLIPLVGATLGAIFVGVATITVDFPTATIVWVAFIIVWQRFEDYVVQPLVYGKTLQVNPIVTIVSVLAGAALLGILGALLAIPIAAAIQIVLRDWWRNRGHPAPARDYLTHHREDSRAHESNN